MVRSGPPGRARPRAQAQTGDAQGATTVRTPSPVGIVPQPGPPSPTGTDRRSPNEAPNGRTKMQHSQPPQRPSSPGATQPSESGRMIAPKRMTAAACQAPGLCQAEPWSARPPVCPVFHASEPRMSSLPGPCCAKGRPAGPEGPVSSPKPDISGSREQGPARRLPAPSLPHGCDAIGRQASCNWITDAMPAARTTRHIVDPDILTERSWRFDVCGGRTILHPGDAAASHLHRPA